MRWIRTKEQKDNLAKACWDPFKITIAALVIAPLAKPEAMDSRALAVGLFIGMLFAFLGYILDGKEIKS
jgi:hypothetical protein